MVLYTTRCPKCDIVKKMMKDKNINFDICDDINKMQDKNIKTVPLLELDNGERKIFNEIISFLSESEE